MPFWHGHLMIWLCGCGVVGAVWCVDWDGVGFDSDGCVALSH